MAKQSQAEFVKWFGPLLDSLRALGDSGKPCEVADQIAKDLQLSDEVLGATTKSGQNRFQNQVAWARQYLVWEGLVESSQRGTWSLTEKGRTTHLSPQDASEIFRKWVAINALARRSETTQTPASETTDTGEVAPEEVLGGQSPGLIETLRSLSSVGFEKVCRELLRESGFTNVEVTAGSADGGIDGFGILEVNPFVSFKVLFQCKRYAAGNLVSRPQVGDFRNAMIGRGEKGIIITTSAFTQAAIQEANREGAPKVELVDGEKLVEMFEMFERVELGLKKRVVYDVDPAYFARFVP